MHNFPRVKPLRGNDTNIDININNLKLYTLREVLRDLSMPSLFIVPFALEENTDRVSMKILSNFSLFMRSGDALPNDNRQLQQSIISHNFSYLKCLLVHSLLFFFF